jgi:hypothetical protein
MLPEETPQVPSAADPPSDRASADLPTAPSADIVPGMPPSAASAPKENGDASPGDQPRRRRRRRRRRPPGDAGAAAAGGPAVMSADQAPSDANGADLGPGVGASEHEASTEPGAQSAPPATGDRPHRRRRRRRRPPGGLGSALPPADPGAVVQNVAGDGSQPESAADSGPGAAAANATGGATRYLRLPVRGRRRLPRPPGLQRGTAEAAPPSGDTAEGEAAAGTPRAEGEFPHRRRRPSPRIGDAVPTGQDPPADGARQEAGRPPRARGPNRRPGEERPRDPQPPRFGEQQHRGPGRGPRDGDAAGPARRERGDRAARGRSPAGSRDGRRGLGREAPARRVEQKLYTLESTVDRGFEDVADEAEDSGTRRVHWTIVKRTVADQKSGKPMSATYVLQREGEDTEFPNLGAARTAANKTIVHPEKLTMSKAEHVAAKNTDGRR